MAFGHGFRAITGADARRLKTRTRTIKWSKALGRKACPEIRKKVIEQIDGVDKSVLV